METPTTPMHVGGVALLPARGGFDHGRLVELISRRIALVPRYRQKVRWVPGRLANPVWVDDEDFDVTYHVRLSALPRPGSDDQLRDLVGRLMSRQLDRSRPLWEIYLVEGLSEGRVAIVTKTHHAMVDGVSAVDIGTVMLDVTAEPREVPYDDWHPARGPGPAALVAGAYWDALKQPTQALEAARSAALDARRDGRAGRGPGQRGAGLGPHHRARRARVAAQRPDRGAAPVRHGGDRPRRLPAGAQGARRHGQRRRARHRGRRAAGLAAHPRRAGRAVDHGAGDGAGVGPPRGAAAMGNRVSSYFVDLPVGEGSAAVRLAQVSYAMRAHKESGQSVGAEALVQLSGFAPPTIHALGARVASGMTRRMFNLVVTNVPGPQFPLYAAGARMLQMYPVVPLAKGQAVSIGLTSYDGGVYYGLNADRDAMPDVDVLAACLEDSLAELVGTAAG